MAIHAPAYHLLDDDWPDKDDGIRTPTRSRGAAPAGSVPAEPNASLVCAAAGLRLRERPADAVATIGQYLDLTDPPGYRPNTIPRGPFNENVMAITAEAMMPEIQVRCLACDFDPVYRPIHWRLECHYVICRHTNGGGYRYTGASQAMGRQWQGRAFKQNFTLFAPLSDPSLVYDYGSPLAVCGGHAVLSVALREPSAPGGLLLDYAHLRIGGTNPSQEDVLAYTESVLAGRNANVVRMVRAIWRHEAGFKQFRAAAQTSDRITFTLRSRFHTDPAQPDCPVTFEHPRDPEGFPLASFDFGVGISQITWFPTNHLTGDQCWDWRENIKAGMNIFFSRLHTTYPRPGAARTALTWRAWARAAWARYNGSGAAAARYADDVQGNDEGRQVPDTPVPTNINLAVEAAAVPPSPALPPPPAWPPSP
jgi:hypothetical protein